MWLRKDNICEDTKHTYMSKTMDSPQHKKPLPLKSSHLLIATKLGYNIGYISPGFGCAVVYRTPFVVLLNPHCDVI